MIRRPPRSPLFPYPTSSDLQTPSNHMPAESWRARTHLALPAASRRTGGDEKHYWLEAAADIIHSGRDERSEEHTSELQSHLNIVCRLLLEKKTLVHYYYSAR